MSRREAKSGFGSFAGGDRFLLGRKISKLRLSSVFLNPSAPKRRRPLANAGSPTFVVAPQTAVEVVLRLRHRSQVRQDIIAADTISVVNEVRLNSVNHFPDDAMNKLLSPLNEYLAVSSEQGLAGQFSREASHSPPELPAIWIIVKPRPKTLGA